MKNLFAIVLLVTAIVLTGCGTSWHAGLVGEYLIEEFARVPVEVEYASELRYRNPPMNDRTMIFAITLHEAAHGYVAKHFGDLTAYRLGRVSLNPLRHVDPIGTILVPLAIFNRYQARAQEARA